MHPDDLLAQVARLAPGAHDLDTELADLPVVARLALVRWLADRLERPVDHEVLARLRTLGDAWQWLEDCRRAGEPLVDPGAPTASAGTTSRVRLRPLLDDDLVPLYLASFDPATASAWRYRGRTLPPEEFVASLADGVRAQYVVELLDDGQAVGLVSAYDHHASGLHCKVAFVRFGPRPPGSAGAVIEGMLLFITHLFASFPYRKVYAEVPSYNLGLYAPGFAQEEGVLRDYLFHEGEPADLHIVSFRRDQWEQVRAGTGW